MKHPLIMLKEIKYFKGHDKVESNCRSRIQLKTDISSIMFVQLFFFFKQKQSSVNSKVG